MMKKKTAFKYPRGRPSCAGPEACALAFAVAHAGKVLSALMVREITDVDSPKTHDLFRRNGMTLLTHRDCPTLLQAGQLLFWPAGVALPKTSSTFCHNIPKCSDVAQRPYAAVEVCAGGGGQALGLEMAGFEHLACVEYEPDFCKTLRLNRPTWNVVCQDIRTFDGKPYVGCDLLSGGVPCPPFSIAGKQLGKDDERDMFPSMLHLVEIIRPRAVLIENVKGLLSSKFEAYRDKVIEHLSSIGYQAQYRLLEAADYGVPQLRPRFVLIAMREADMIHFKWPTIRTERMTIGEALGDLMAAAGWKGAKQFKKLANSVAPTLVGGSKKHGGPDLGPTRARAQWKALGIDGIGIANAPPDSTMPENVMPRLTLQMASRVQGFPDDWKFYGGKTIAYRQIGNAFPPPVARAIGKQIIRAFKESDHA